MALLGKFRQAKDITGSFDETAGYRSCKSPLELCSMWSLRVANFAQHARRRSGWRVARGVDQKCQKTENNVYRWQCAIQGFAAMYYVVKSWNELLSGNKISWNRQIPCATGKKRRYKIHPQLKAGRSSWRICRLGSHLFDLQEQLSNHRPAPLVGTLP